MGKKNMFKTKYVLEKFLFYVFGVIICTCFFFYYNNNAMMKNALSSMYGVLTGAFIGAALTGIIQININEDEHMYNEEEKEKHKTDLEKVKLQFCFYKLNSLLRNLGIIYRRILDLKKPEMRGRKIPIAGMQIKFNDYDLQFLVLKIPLLLEEITQLEVEQNDLLQQLDEMNEYNHVLLLYDTNLHGALIGMIAKMYAKIISLMCVIDKYLQNKYYAETLRKDYVKENMDEAEKFVIEMDEKNPDLKLKEIMEGWTIDG